MIDLTHTNYLGEPMGPPPQERKAGEGSAERLAEIKYWADTDLDPQAFLMGFKLLMMLREVLADYEIAPKGTPCAVHGTADERGPFLGGVLSVPPCATGVYSNAEYGAWGAGAGGFLYTESCALLVANWAAQEMAKDGEDADEYTVLRICPDHPEESADGCEYCTSGDYEEED